jgi:hypothetical protein
MKIDVPSMAHRFEVSVTAPSFLLNVFLVATMMLATMI